MMSNTTTQIERGKNPNALFFIKLNKSYFTFPTAISNEINNEIFNYHTGF